VVTAAILISAAMTELSAPIVELSHRAALEICAPQGRHIANRVIRIMLRACMRSNGGIVRRSRSETAAQDPSPPPPNPSEAWQALALVNDWVKHAETKLGVILTVAGVSGGILFNLVKNEKHTFIAFDISSAACAIFIFATAACSMAGLYPRLRLRRGIKIEGAEGANPLFFHDIARAYKDAGPSYEAVLHTLTTNPSDMVRHLGHQIHANATIAQRKFRWANTATRFLVLDLLALGSLGALVALKR
jgi:hypothetical protein